MSKKNYQLYDTLLIFIKSFDKYNHVESMYDLSEKDICLFAKIYYLE